jgi:leucyl aminopeptidase
VARQAGIDLAKSIKELKVSHVVLCATTGGLVLDIAEGFFSGFYTQVGFKGQKKNEQRFPAKLSLLGTAVSVQKIRELVEFSKSQIIVRFLQDAPPNYLTPKQFAAVAKDISAEFGLTCKVLGREEMSTLGMGMFLSVAVGSIHEPQCICIEIPGLDNSKSIALVGKGLTFDSGGISIKGSAGMEEMKYDMSGGAAVLGVARYFATVKPPVKVVCVIGAAENMPSGAATKPSDVAKAFNGKTVEILNTDAEGRLVLGDCLAYTIKEYKPVLIADIATLTGAVLMALGCVGGAVFGSDQAAADRALQAAAKGGEPFWQLPLWPELEKEVKGDTADLKNIAKPNVKAGTIMGAWFLKEFIGQTPWVHFDIAGTAWNCQAVGYPSSGAAAFGFRTLVNLCHSED